MEPTQISEITFTTADTTERKEVLIPQSQDKSDKQENGKLEEKTSLRSSMSVNLLIYLIYKITFKNVN
jgi:hypothetical protein